MRSRKLPQSAVYRLIKRLVEVGLTEFYGGIDHRKKIYDLTNLGKSVGSKVVGMVKAALKSKVFTTPASKIEYLG